MTKTMMIKICLLKGIRSVRKKELNIEKRKKQLQAIIYIKRFMYYLVIKKLWNP